MRLKQAMTAALAVTIVGGATLASARMPPRWDIYRNARFDYQICYPVNALTPEAEADNGDGRGFIGQRGAQMRVWGSNNALDETLDAKMNKVEMWVSDSDPRAYPRINYKRRTGNYYVVSGNSRSEDFYEKTILKNGQFITMQIRYPQKDKIFWRPMVTRISNCFR